MAKRLTDTKKWESGTFRNLPHKYKLLYLFMLDLCDSTGVMHLDIALLNFHLKDRFTLEAIKENLGTKVIFLAEDKIIIKNYIAFQNGDIQDSKSSIAKSIRSSLNAHGLWERYSAGEFGHVNKAISIWDS